MMFLGGILCQPCQISQEKKEKKVRLLVDISPVSGILFLVMRDMFENMYEVRIANSGDVAGFPRSHDGLEKAIILASREGTEVTFDGDVVWPEEEPDMDESMDGDHESALASAGFGTDEDYGCFDAGDEW